MEKEILFHNNNEVFTNIDLLNSLRSIKADECDILYIHTSLNFGTPNTNIKKNELLQYIVDTILELKVATIIFPTYTFSFCNGEDFDINSCKTSMGLLNDYVRKMPNSIRSIDPLMSNVLLGEHTEFVKNIGKNSVGLDSTFDLLHKTKLKVKFLFIGPKIGDCFTHMHFIEAEQNVPYRYYKDFTGKINNGNEIYTDTYSLFVRYNKVFANCGSYIYENMMLEKNIAQKEKFANGYLTIVESQEAYNAYLYFLKISPNFYIQEIFDINKCDISFNVSKMVAL
jgi:aminoglycoside 3-N-acetyltransferase